MHLKLPTLKFRSLLGDTIEVLKIIHDRNGYGFFKTELEINYFEFRPKIRCSEVPVTAENDRATAAFRVINLCHIVPLCLINLMHFESTKV